MSTSVPSGGTSELLSEPEISCDLGDLEERRLGLQAVVCSALRVSEQEEELASGLIIVGARGLERVERRLVETRGILVCEQRERSIAGALAYSSVMIASGG